MIRPKFRICKRYETDVWAELLEKRKKTNLAKSILIKNKFLLRKQSAFYFFPASEMPPIVLFVFPPCKH